MRLPSSARLLAARQTPTPGHATCDGLATGRRLLGQGPSVSGLFLQGWHTGVGPAFPSQLGALPCVLGSGPATQSQRRRYATMGSNWSFSKVQYTKYRITKPWTTDTMFDDIILSQPSKDDFAKFTKEAPLFLRFLKLVTDVEGRQDAFIQFARRCENGLTVEKDVYVTKKELLECLWKNGYSDTEINAFEIAFPGDYKFHYPELAVLFELSEEDCYKYCLRQRAAKPEELVELKYKKPNNLVSSYGLCFLGVWFGFSNTVLSNAWFYSKTFPFGAVFYMLGSYFYRDIREKLWKEEKALIHTAQENKNMGEESVYKQMKQYANDTKCLDYLSKFRGEVEDQIAAYKKALVSQMRRQLTERLVEKLNGIQQAEKLIQGSLQEVMVREIVASFRDTYGSRPQLQEEAMRSALQGLSGSDNVMDPVGAHFKASLQELAKVNLSTTAANPAGSVVERVAAVFQKREKEFLDSFTVKASEAQEIRQLVGKCQKGNAFDFHALSEEDLCRLEQLYSTVNNRVGFETLHEDAIKPIVPMSENSRGFVDFVNTQLEITKAKLRNARLTAFAGAFV
ncbi:hypothetical protein BESB_009910 [Besnoitia besnoiti]|uniref:Uncharacterized protein n=1 Tax=Besnoitia besnoiti TaxID=94643 RepID=A0A2A9ML06_BESBE|nr:hypothetical protein BESB_009910 [Besnoitia besnoiti]PFH38649.1 hypothetical protein BESB_009910 [Besnoitia besnoiti]